MGAHEAGLDDAGNEVIPEPEQYLSAELYADLMAFLLNDDILVRADAKRALLLADRVKNATGISALRRRRQADVTLAAERAEIRFPEPGPFDLAPSSDYALMHARREGFVEGWKDRSRRTGRPAEG